MRILRAFLWSVSFVLASVVAVGFGSLLMGASTSPREGAVFNVRNCGAKGDGTTNDTLAIRKCYGYIAANGGGVLYFPGGTYIVSRQSSESIILDLPNGTTARGDGKASIIKLAPTWYDSNVDTWRIIGSNHNSTNGERYDITIEYLTVDGTVDATRACSGSREDSHGIMFIGQNATSGYNFTVHDVLVKNVGGDGVNFGNLTNYVRAYNVKVENACRAGFVFAGANGSVDGSFDNVFDEPHPLSSNHRSFDCEVTSGHGSKLRITNSFFQEAEIAKIDDVYFGGNIIDGAIDVANVEKIHFVGNTINTPSTSTSATLNIDATANDFLFSNNIFTSEYPGDGLKINNSGGTFPYRLVITGNVFHSTADTTLSAIRMTGVNGAIVSDNLITSDDGKEWNRGIYIDGGKDITVTGNVITGAATDGIQIEGKNNTSSMTGVPAAIVAMGATSFTITDASGFYEGFNYEVWTNVPAYVETVHVTSVSGTTITLESATTAAWAVTNTFKRRNLDIEGLRIIGNTVASNGDAINLGDSSATAGPPAFSCADGVKKAVMRDNTVMKGTRDYADSLGGQCDFNFVQRITIPDDGAGTSPTVTTAPNMNTRYIEITCNDPNGCIYSPDDDARAKEQDEIIIVNVSAANTVSLTTVAGDVVVRGSPLVLASGEGAQCISTGTPWSCW